MIPIIRNKNVVFNELLLPVSLIDEKKADLLFLPKIKNQLATFSILTSEFFKFIQSSMNNKYNVEIYIPKDKEVSSVRSESVNDYIELGLIFLVPLIIEPFVSALKKYLDKKKKKFIANTKIIINKDKEKVIELEFQGTVDELEKLCKKIKDM